MDNGHGMSLETMQTTGWTATLFRSVRAEGAVRAPVLGEKDIGRLRLPAGNTLEVVTRRSAKIARTEPSNWMEVDDEQKYWISGSLWRKQSRQDLCPGEYRRCGGKVRR